MRVACVYIPAFPLQVLIRNAPHLAGKAVAVSKHPDGAVNPDRDRPRIEAMSRAAWEAGVRPGMTPASARATAPGLIVLPADPAANHAAIAALAESLLGVSSVVDTGGDLLRAHKALFAAVPHGSRGSTFGDKLITAANRQGLRARVGIADDRFAAWTAAAVPNRSSDPANANLDGQPPPFTQTVITIPRGGAAAFLAPMPLALLPLDEDVRHLLATLKVRTIGDFAALPPPTVGRRLTDTGVDVHQLARGAGPSALSRFVPSGFASERLDLESESTDIEPIAFLLHPVVDRLCERLRGRARAASSVTVTLANRRGDSTRLDIAMTSPTSSGRAILDALRAVLIATPMNHTVSRVTVQVAIETEPEAEELELFSQRPHRRTRRGKRGRSRSRQQALPLGTLS